MRCSTPAQRPAPDVRDGGRVVPGCDAPSGWLEGHHVVDRAVDGLTDVDDAVLACGPHHAATPAPATGAALDGDDPP